MVIFLFKKPNHETRFRKYTPQRTKEISSFENKQSRTPSVACVAHHHTRKYDNSGLLSEMIWLDVKEKRDV